MKDLGLTKAPWITWVRVESNFQIMKWGIQDRGPFEWLAFTTEELGELAEAISEWNYRGGSEHEVVREAIQVATLALKIAEMFSDRISAQCKIPVTEG